MINLGKAVALLSSAMLLSATTLAAEFEVGQKYKRFSVKELKIKMGDSVKFTNQDPFFHNVFSLSVAKTFDLGSYPKGKFKTVTFDTAGKVEVECAIHPNMYLVITVE